MLRVLRLAGLDSDIWRPPLLGLFFSKPIIRFENSVVVVVVVNNFENIQVYSEV